MLRHRCSRRVSRRRPVLVGAVTSVLACVLAAPVGAAGATATEPTGTRYRDSPARAGYSSSHVPVTMVSANFTVPEIDCTATPNGGLNIVVSLERKDHSTPDRIGISLSCRHGQPVYTAWAKWRGRALFPCQGTPQPGELEDAEIYVSGRVVLGSSDCGEIFTNQSSTGFPIASVEVRRQTGPAGHLRALPNFGTVYFWQAQVNRASMGLGDVVDWRMADHGATVLAVPSGLHDDGSFAVNWRASR